MSKRIVVADDDQDIRRLIVFTLKRRGYTVLEAGNGQAALDLVLAERPDMVILDVMMPLMTGLEVTARLKDNPETAATPVLILSARGQEGEIQEGLGKGAHAYLVKPFAPQELASYVMQLLQD